MFIKGKDPLSHCNPGGMETETIINFKYERETKNKFRFKEDAEVPVMGTVYVSKTLFDERPKELEVTLKIIG